MPAMQTDFIMHVSDNGPPLDIILMGRDGPSDLTNILSAEFYFRASGASANVVSGAGSTVLATAGRMRFHFSTAALGSNGFSSSGYYIGQFWGSWASGRQSSMEFTVEVKPTYRSYS